LGLVGVPPGVDEVLIQWISLEDLEGIAAIAEDVLGFVWKGLGRHACAGPVRDAVGTAPNE
jgi:hypothetical protein